ncbi:MAG: hypothetical protein GY786_22550 [Proteobacteria bacterium]|nr:hypothetical protein [Pseudomonadota bacterium]
MSRYMSRATISVERVDFDRGDQTVTVLEKQEQPFSKTASYSIMDFLGLLACHIPSTYESLIYYYGIYSSPYRENGEERHGRKFGIQCPKYGNYHRFMTLIEPGTPTKRPP